MLDVEKLDPDDPRPPYRVLADALRARIKRDDFGPGAQLPSYQALSDEYDVSVSTAKSAVKQLSADGLVVTRQGKGTFVRTRGVVVNTHDSAPATDSAVAAGGSVHQRLASLEADVTKLRKQVEELTARQDATERP